MPHLPRLRLHFNRRAIGRLRILIDRLNELAPVPAPPFDARRRAIFDAPLPPGQVEAEEDESEWGVG
jgi:hypothetical protein